MDKANKQTLIQSYFNCSIRARKPADYLSLCMTANETVDVFEVYT